MSGKLGMNVGDVRKLGKSLKADADELDRVVRDITRTLNKTYWEGKDAQRFRNEWQGAHTKALKQVASALDTAGETARTNAEQQDQASN
ncbi:hypothetical protein Xcel_0495 [Xylanimonas cellulosilytica DSM 15894]|uniref:WXG100 family type VII secretion target n=1 Tax=Xylanimonas cellulosilytica (strain DSM 15894 / JCM 12276 / CECT 5975 / KCTC 9989 / LMG 20990 / NBRC 107835 / XIL07) TaxID=446471 RepID=D1BW31_XYLCX|nr:hypothetical protein [Xylanimonas cellulosilytica]ACZ29534.1 hypothetical protein Xcel_0495 [Xylanimonas cellulosilytica DSM 15894]